MDTSKIRQLLTLDEGLKLFPYEDTVGKLTIGIGHNLTDNGVSQDVVDLLFSEDLAKAQAVLDRLIPVWTSFEEPRQAAFLDLAFNLGSRLSQFAILLRKASQGAWNEAAGALQDSLWYRQVGVRGPRIVQMLASGAYPSQLA